MSLKDGAATLTLYTANFFISHFKNKTSLELPYQFLNSVVYPITLTSMIGAGDTLFNAKNVFFYTKVICNNWQ